MKCAQCALPLSTTARGHGEYRPIGTAAAFPACSTACARATTAPPNSVHSVHVTTRHPLHAVLAANPVLVAAVGSALSDGTFHIERPAVATPLVRWIQQIGPKRSVYDDDVMEDADDELRGARTMDRTPNDDFTWRDAFTWRADPAAPAAPAAPPATVTVPTSQKRNAHDYLDEYLDDEADRARRPPAMRRPPTQPYYDPFAAAAPAPPPAEPYRDPLATVAPVPPSAADARRPPAEPYRRDTLATVAPAPSPSPFTEPRTPVAPALEKLPPLRAGPVRTPKRTVDNFDDDDDMDMARPLGQPPPRIPTVVALEMVRALVMSGVIPLTSTNGMVSLAKHIGTGVAALEAHIRNLPAGLISDAASSLMKQRPATQEARLHISVAASLLLRYRPMAAVVKNSRTLTTPLHWAAYGGYAAVADVAITNGGDINGADAYGFTPLDYAVANGQSAHTADLGQTMAAWLEERGGMRSGRAFS